MPVSLVVPVAMRLVEPSQGIGVSAPPALVAQHGTVGESDIVEAVPEAPPTASFVADSDLNAVAHSSLLDWHRSTHPLPAAESTA